MTKLTILCALLALGAGCKKKAGDDKPVTHASNEPVGSGSAPVGSGSAPAAGSGSAMAAGSGSGSAAAAPVTAESMQKFFETCWGYFNDAKWDDFKNCYAADATQEVPGLGAPALSGNAAIAEGAKAYKAGFPDMKGEAGFIMISGHTILAASLLTGTQSGALKLPGMELPATNKKTGLFFVQVVDIDDAGKAKKELQFWDTATMLGQINPQKDAPPVRPVMDKVPGPKEVVVAKDDDKEKGNLATAQKFIDNFNKKDAKAVGDMLDDKVMWSELAEAKDQNKAEALKAMTGLWKAFSDLKFTIAKSWAAGDYVAMIGSFDGTNDGDGDHMKKTGKKVALPFLQVMKIEGGKATQVYTAYQTLGFMAQMGLMPPTPAAKK